MPRNPQALLLSNSDRSRAVGAAAHLNRGQTGRDKATGRGGGQGREGGGQGREGGGQGRVGGVQGRESGGQGRVGGRLSAATIKCMQRRLKSSKNK